MDVPKESQPGEAVAEPKEVSNPILELDLKTAGITSIVGATGFCNDFGWVKLPIFNNTGDPVHRRGVTSFTGIYFLGLRWLYKRKSFFLIMAGPAEDAAYLAEHIKTRGKQIDHPQPWNFT
jgi:putative flavoprotein involved in K+ transport